jgi:hypothetical protein
VRFEVVISEVRGVAVFALLQLLLEAAGHFERRQGIRAAAQRLLPGGQYPPGGARLPGGVGMVE